MPTESPGCCGESPPSVGRLHVADTDVAVGELATIAGNSISWRSNEIGDPSMPPRMMIGAVVRSKNGIPVDAGV